MSLPELQQNPLVQRVIDIFDTDGNGEVDFKGKENMVCKLSNFCMFPVSQLKYIMQIKNMRLHLGVIWFWPSYVLLDELIRCLTKNLATWP